MRLRLAVASLVLSGIPIWLWSIGAMAQDSQAASVRWTDISPVGLPNGRVQGIAVDPSNQNHWLVGVGNGGVWETRNAGASFVPLSDDWPTLTIGAVAFAPSDPLTVYVGTGEDDAAGF